MRFLAAMLCAACGGGGIGHVEDPFQEPSDHDVGRPVLGFMWHRTIADHEHDHMPVEFASPAVTPEAADAPSAHRGQGRLYVGSHAGIFFALSSDDGAIAWTRKVGATSSPPLLVGQVVYVGTDDGMLYALEVDHGGKDHFPPYATGKGAILESPVLAGDTIVFATDADHVAAIDKDTGKYRWQYDRETPQGFTIRGHAGMVVAGDRVITGFSDGHLVALSQADGEVVWVRALGAEGNAASDVDSTPLVAGNLVIAASASGGIYGVDVVDGTDRWRVDVKGVSHLAMDGHRVYAAAPDDGLTTLDLHGHVLWRQGFWHSGDPAQPVIDGKYLFYATGDDGLFVIDKVSGQLYQTFDPGTGFSSAPAIVGDRLFMLSNGGELYAMSIGRY